MSTPGSRSGEPPTTNDADTNVPAGMYVPSESVNACNALRGKLTARRGCRESYLVAHGGSRSVLTRGEPVHSHGFLEAVQQVETVNEICGPSVDAQCVFRLAHKRLQIRWSICEIQQSLHHCLG